MRSQSRRHYLRLLPLLLIGNAAFGDEWKKPWPTLRQGAMERCAGTFDDYSLQAVCVQNEQEGHVKMQGDFGLPSVLAEGAKRRCEQVFQDFSLQAVCMQNEAEGYRKLHAREDDTAGSKFPSGKQRSGATQARSRTAQTRQAVSSSAETIAHHCESQWPQDFRMRAYCEGQQREALHVLSLGNSSGVPKEDFDTLRRHCEVQWPGDFKMRAYCEEQQVKGIRLLSQPMPSDIPESAYSVIRQHCHSEWPDDFHMRAFCQDRQYEGVRQLR
jgi:hypothetical protein